MARFIVVEVERPDPDDEDGSKPMLSDKYYFSPLKIKYLKNYEDTLMKLNSADADNEKKSKEDPNFVPKPFEAIEQIGDLLFDLIKVKHKKMERKEFEDIFGLTDYHEIMGKLAPAELT